MQTLRLKPLRINNIITTPLIKPEALPNKERPRLYVSAFPQPEKSLPKMPYVLSTRGKHPVQAVLHKTNKPKS